MPERLTAAGGGVVSATHCELAFILDLGFGLYQQALPGGELCFGGQPFFGFWLRAALVLGTA